MPGSFELSPIEIRLILAADASQLTPFQQQVKATLADVQSTTNAASTAIQASMRSIVAPTDAATESIHAQALALHDLATAAKEQQFVFQQELALQASHNQALQTPQQFYQQATGGQVGIPPRPTIDDTQAAQQKLAQEYAASTQGVQVWTAATQDAEKSMGKLSATTLVGANNVGQFSKGVASGLLQMSLLGGGFLLAGRAITEFTTGAIDDFHNIEKEAQNLSTVQIGLDTQSAEASLERLQSEVPATLKAISDSYYEISSVGGQTAQVSEELTKQITTGAASARADTKTWTDDVIGSMNQFQLWGQTADETYANASKVQAEFYQASKDSLGTPAQFAQAWGAVALAVQQSGGSIEDALALMVAASKGVGNFQQNMTNLQRFLNEINTDKARAELQAFGIQVQNVDGTSRTANQILSQLQDKLKGLTQGQQVAIVDQLFPQERATRGVETLLSNLDTVSSEYPKLTDSAKGWADANASFLDTNAAKTQELENRFLSFKEELGKTIDPVRILFNFVQQANQSGGTLTPEGRIGATGDTGAAPSPQGIIGGPAPFLALQMLFGGQGGQSIQQQVQDGVTGAEAWMRHMDQEWEKDSSSINRNLGAVGSNFQDLYQKIGGGKGLETPFEKWNDQLNAFNEAVRGASAGFQAELANKLGASQISPAASILPSDQQTLLAQASAAADSATNGAINKAASTIAQNEGKIQVLWTELLSPTISDADKQRVASEIQSVIGLVDTLLEKEKEAIDTASNLNQVANLQSQAQNPDLINSVVQLKKAQDDYNNSVEQGEKAAGLITQTTREKAAQTAEEKAKELPLQQQANDLQKQLNALQQADADKMDALKAKQQAINAELDAANLALYQTTQFYDQLIKQATDKERADKAAEAAALGTTVPGNPTGLTKQLQDDALNLKNYTDQANEQLHTLDQTLYSLDQSARETTLTMITGFDNAGQAIYKTVTIAETLDQRLRSTPAYLAAQENLKQAQGAMDALQAHAAYVKQGFDDEQYAIDRASRAIEDKYRPQIAQAQAQVDSFRQALDDLNRSEELALRAPEDRIYALQQRMQGAQDILSGLQGKMRDLQALDAQAQAEQTRLGQQTGIENLQGRLVNATGANRADLQNQLEQQQASYQRGIQEDALQIQIDKQQKVVDGVNAQLQAQQRLEAQIQHGYDLQKRIVSDNLHDAQLQLDAVNRRYNQEKDVLDLEQTRLTREEQDQARQEEIDRRAIQEGLSWATEQARVADAAVTRLEGIWQGVHDNVTNTKTDEANYFTEHEKQMNNMVTNDQANINSVKGYWDGLIGKEDDDLNKLKDVATQEETTKQAAVDAITKPGGTKWAIDQEITKQGDRATAAEQAAQRQHTAVQTTLTDLQQEYSYLVAIQGINENLAKATPPNVGPPPTATVPGTPGYPGTSANPPPHTGGMNLRNPGFTTVPLGTQAVPAGATGSVGGLTINGNLNVTTPIPATRSEVNDFADLVFSRAQQRWGRR